MKAWAYVAYDDGGKRRKGVVVADTEAQASSDLRAKGLFVETLDAQTDAPRPWRRLGAGLTGRAGLTADMRAVFMRQLAVMLEAGLTVEQVLDTVAQSDTSPQIQSLAQRARAGLMSGLPLSTCLAQSGSGYPPYAVSALAAGETAGNLAQVTTTLADHLETERAEQAGLATVLIYPAFVTGVAVIVAAVLLRTVAPEVARLYETTGQALPTLTRVMMGIEAAASRLWPYLAGLVAVTWLGVALGLRYPAFRRRWQRMRLATPLIGRFTRLRAASQYLRTLAVLVQSRQPIVPGMQSACTVLDIMDFRDEAARATRAVERGQSLSNAVSEISFVPVVARQLMLAGESSGRLGHMTDRATVMVESRLATERKRISALIEPFLMVVVGGLVLTIVLSILLPIFDLQAGINL